MGRPNPYAGEAEGGVGGREEGKKVWWGAGVLGR